MKLFLLMVCTVLMVGCAGKGLNIEYTDPEGKQVKIDTDYQVENGFKMERDGEGYRIELGSATTKDAEWGMINSMMQMMMQFMMGQTPVPVPPDDDG